MFYAFGINYYNIHNNANSSCNDSQHAEVNCVLKLKKREKKTNINLIVFRTNNRGDCYMMAKPCNNCLTTIDITLKKKNYVLKKFYYTENNSIIKL